jgi:hypothetical protein
MEQFSQQLKYINASKGKGKVIPVHAMKAYRVVEIELHSLTSSLDRGEWSASHPGHFTPRERPGYPLNRKLGWCHSQLRCFGDECKNVQYHN